MPDATLKDVATAHAAGRMVEARALCDRVLAQTPLDGDALMWSGLIAMAQSRLPEAIAAFERALSERLDPWSLANFGACYAKVGELEAAERALRGATELKADLYGAHIGLAAVLHGLRRFDEALARLDIASTLAARDHQVDLRRGCTLAELGLYDEAQEAFGRVNASSGAFTYARLVRFDRPTFEHITAVQPAASPPRVEVKQALAPEALQGVVLISCNPAYARKYGAPFLRSYAAHECAGHLLHLHIPDPDEAIVDELTVVARGAGLERIAITTEVNPFPAQEAQQRRSYYACARFLHLPYWLEHYQVPIVVLDVDFIVESPLQVLFDSVGDSDLALNARHPMEAPWLDVIANVIVASPQPASMRYFAAVASYARMHLEREPRAWLVDQAALYCTLRMFERYGGTPRVRWLPEAHKSGLWHIGHMYDHLLDDPRFRRWA